MEDRSAGAVEVREVEGVVGEEEEVAVAGEERLVDLRRDLGVEGAGEEDVCCSFLIDVLDEVRTGDNVAVMIAAG